MPFKHLFIFPHPNVLRNFHHRLEEKMRYSGVPHRARMYGRLTMMSNDGEHEIICVTVDEIERDSHRLRGCVFDKVSVHEEVELTDRIHTFLQFCVARTNHSLYGSLGSIKIEVSPQVSDDRIYFLREESFVSNPHISEHYLDALRYSLMPDPKFHGVIRNVAF